METSWGSVEICGDLSKFGEESSVMGRSDTTGRRVEFRGSEPFTPWAQENNLPSSGQEVKAATRARARAEAKMDRKACAITYLAVGRMERGTERQWRYACWVSVK